MEEQGRKKRIKLLDLLQFTCNDLKALEDAIIRQDVACISSFNPLSGDVTNVLRILLNTDFCERLKGQSYLALWRAYNFELTAIAASFYGIHSDAVVSLRRLNSQMQFNDIVAISPEDLIVEKDCINFVHTGLALQAFLDVHGAVLSKVRITNIILVAQGLVQGPCGQYQEEWLFLLQKAFKETDLQEFKANDYSEIALEPLNLVLAMLEKDHAEDSAAEKLFVHIFRSLSFRGLVKVLRLLLKKAESVKRLQRLLDAGRIRISASWQGGDATAMAELRMILNDLYQSDKICIDQNCTLEQLDVVVAAVQLYILVVLKVARGKTEYDHLLDATEIGVAKSWLQRLLEQTSSVTESLVRKEAAKAIRMGLLLVDNPRGYPYGVPLD